MRDWTKARPASFRGVGFRVMEDGPAVGRRLAVHEVSGGETAMVEDMGRRTVEISIDAYVAGDDADAAGRRLEAACATPGAGLLRLPFDPAVMAHCASCSRSRHKDRNGMISYSLDFIAAADGASGFASGLSAVKGIFDALAAAAARGLS